MSSKIQLSNLFANIKPTPMVLMTEAASKYNNVITLGIGEPDFNTDDGIKEALYKAAKDGYTHYPPLNGYPDLREEIANYWNKKYSLNTSADNVVITVGATQAIYLVMQMILNPGDEVAVVNPCYTCYFQMVEYLHGKVVSVPVYEKDNFNLTAETLEKCITDKTKILLINSPNNPTGAVLEKEEMEKIAEVVKKHNLVVISDEVYESFIFDGKHIPFATIPGMEDRTFTVAGFSKTYAMTGWRIGYVIGPKEVLNPMRILMVAVTMGINGMVQKAALYALRNCDNQVKRMMEEYKRRIDFTYERINKMPGLSMLKPRGTFYAFVNIKNTGMNSIDFAWKMLEEAQVLVIPGVAYGKDTGEGYVRLSLTVPIEKLDEAFTRMENVLRKLG